MQDVTHNDKDTSDSWKQYIVVLQEPTEVNKVKVPNILSKSKHRNTTGSQLLDQNTLRDIVGGFLSVTKPNNVTPNNVNAYKGQKTMYLKNTSGKVVKHKVVKSTVLHVKSVERRKYLRNLANRNSSTEDMETILIDDDPAETSASEITASVQVSNDESEEKTMRVLDEEHSKHGVYMLNQSEFESLPTVCSEPTDDATTHNGIDEEIVVNPNQVHVLNESNNYLNTAYNTDEIKDLRNVICRTCLKLVPAEDCKKLFELDDTEECQILRDSLSYISPDTDLNVSSDPVVCLKCATLIDITYSFKQRLKDVQDTIDRFGCRNDRDKRKVDLRRMLIKFAGIPKG
ncbi:hypothetical protein NQ317_002109 [Molorchus minor]|uniref:ZAD domain-containing protein n=1 Tax=Molorchus minor TaxID=1323400 RepID=A0ABQ9JX61_9CUCU|nr:hypothetical protein NQ317_002109 [Molorchus minor]